MPASTVDDYIAAYPPQTQERLNELRAVFREILPGATERIAYGVPTYTLPTGTVAHFGAAKTHCALYGLVSEADSGDLQGYKTSKGTIQFPLDRPVPAGLVRKLVRSRLSAHEAAQAATPTRRSTRPRMEAVATGA
jgi:uncharacterized protein YdhG (YjbR/CyaY superfamily)